MTILAVLRHAKSSWDTPELDDFARPLNERGRKAARVIGEEINRRDIRFDCVIASPATRVRETLDGLTKGYGRALDTHFDDRIYAADAGTLLELIRHVPGDVHAPLLIGHNPGLQQLVLSLTKDDDSGYRRTVAAKFPTAAFALIVLPAARWDEIEPASGEIRELILPRDLND